MSDFNLGTATGKIKVEYDGKGVDQADKDLGRIDKSTKNTQAGFAKAGAASGAAALALGAGIAFSAKKAIDFEKQISAIGAVSGGTQAQLEALRKKALQLGADTVFSASDAAQAMEELAKAGIALPDILNGAADATVALAAAGGIALPEAASLAADAMNSFRLSASDMPKVADLIAGAANASSISVSDFGIALRQVGAVAALVGVSFQDTATAIALMGKFGIKGSDAGTSLKVMLLNLQPATKAQKALFDQLGITVNGTANKFFDAQGKLKGLAEVSGILSTALKGQTQQQKLATLEMIFGQDAIRAAAILSEEGATGFNDMAKAMGKVSASDVASKRLDNVAGAIEQLKGSLETAAIALGTTFLPAIKKTAEFIADIANKFSQLDPKWQKMIGFALVAAAALAALATVAAGVGVAIFAIGAASGALEIVGIIVAVVAAVALLVIGFKKLWDNSKQLRQEFADNIAPAVKQLQDAFAKAWPTIKMIADGMGKILVAALKAVGSALAFVGPPLLHLATVVIGALIKGLAFLVAGIPGFVSVVQSIIRVLIEVGKIVAIAVIAPLYLLWKAAVFVFNAVSAGAAQFRDIMVGIWKVIGPPILAFISGVLSVWKAFFSVISAIAQAGWAVISALFAVGLAILKATVLPVFHAIQAGIEAVFNFLLPIFKAFWSTVFSIVSASVDAIKVVAIPIWNAIKAAAVVAWNVLSAATSVAWNAISAVVKFAVDRIVATAQGIAAFVNRIRDFFNQLKGAAEGGTGSLIAFVAGIPGRILGAIGNMAGLLYRKGQEVIEGFVDGIRSMISKVAGAVGDVVSKAAGFLPGSPAKEGPFSGQGYVKIRGKHLAEDFSTGILSEAKGVADAVAAVARSASLKLPTDFSGTVQSATNVGGPNPTPTVGFGVEQKSSDDGDTRALMAKLDELIAAVTRVAPEVGAELTGVARKTLQVARARG